MATTLWPQLVRSDEIFSDFFIWVLVAFAHQDGSEIGFALDSLARADGDAFRIVPFLVKQPSSSSSAPVTQLRLLTHESGHIVTLLSSGVFGL